MADLKVTKYTRQEAEDIATDIDETVYWFENGEVYARGSSASNWEIENGGRVKAVIHPRKSGYCKHGTYVGGMGIDYMCHWCEMGD